MDIFAKTPYGVEDIITDIMVASVCVSPVCVIILLLDIAVFTGI